MFRIRIQNQGNAYIKVVGGTVEHDIRPGDGAELVFEDEDTVMVERVEPEDPEEAPPPPPEEPPTEPPVESPAPPPAPEPPPEETEPPAPAPEEPPEA